MANISEAIDNVIQTIANDPSKARSRNTPAIAALSGGLQFAVTGPHGESLKTDMPPAMGGTASGPNPGWLLRAALASCTGTVIAMRAERSGIRLTELTVTAESESDNRGLLGMDDRISAGLSNLRLRVIIKADNADAAQLDELVRWADEHSPVGCTVRDGADTSIELSAE